MRLVVALATILALAAATATWGVASTCERPTCETRSIDRLVASPAPRQAASDHVWLRVDVPTQTSVIVDVASGASSTFFLRFGPWGAAEGGSPAPSQRQSVTLGPGAWSVVIDPAVGADVRILATFRGHVIDAEGTGAPFTLRDVEVGDACFLPPDGCLP